MPDGSEGFGERSQPIEHDDIMKRLLAYQRRLQGERADPEVPDPSDDPGVTTDNVGRLEGERDEPGTPSSTTPTDLPTRVAELESTLGRLEEMLGELRRRFQELAVAVDERIAAIQDVVGEARRGDPEG